MVQSSTFYVQFDVQRSECSTFNIESPTRRVPSPTHLVVCQSYASGRVPTRTGSVEVVVLNKYIMV